MAGTTAGLDRHEGFRQFPPVSAALRHRRKGRWFRRIGGFGPFRPFRPSLICLARGCAAAQSPAWRILSPAASRSAMSSKKTSGVGDPVVDGARRHAEEFGQLT
jgi:hypothetical protein